MRIRNGLFHQRPRRGAVMVETAIVLPILFMFLLGTITIGMGIFYYEQVASLAREGARYASVRGSGYGFETGGSAADSGAISTYVSTLATGLDSNSLHVIPTWPDNSSSNAPGNRVRVTVSYQWTPLMYISGPITLSSTSEMVVNY
jgi:Flp pilus assembly protein TadG